MSKATQSHKPRQSKLPAVTGTAKVIQPIGGVNANTGEISINGKPYLCRCLDHAYQLFGFDQKKRQPTNYDLPADLSSCECLDYLSRSDRREDNRCKHQKALAVLVAAGKLPAITCNPVPRVDDLAETDESSLDADAFDDSEADAWHSQYDAA